MGQPLSSNLSAAEQALINHVYNRGTARYAAFPLPGEDISNYEIRKEAAPFFDQCLSTKSVGIKALKKGGRDIKSLSLKKPKAKAHFYKGEKRVKGYRYSQFILSIKSGKIMARYCQNLTYLSVHFQITDKALAPLCKLRAISVLELNDCRLLTPEALNSVSKMAPLEKLVLRRSETLGDRGDRLALLGKLNSLTDLKIGDFIQLNLETVLTMLRSLNLAKLNKFTIESFHDIILNSLMRCCIKNILKKIKSPTLVKIQKKSTLVAEINRDLRLSQEEIKLIRKEKKIRKWHKISI